MNAYNKGTQPQGVVNKTVPANGADTADQSLMPDGPPQDETVDVSPRTRRGFAAMDRKRVCEIASKGGKAVHARGTAHEFTSDEARVAGRKGGYASQAKRRSTN